MSEGGHARGSPLRAVLAATPSRRAALCWVSERALALGRVDIPGARVVADAALAAELETTRRPPSILAIETLDPPLLSIARRKAIALLVWCGDPPSAPDQRYEDAAAADGTRILGPSASLRLSEGRGTVCAPSVGLLEPLRAALDDYAVALCPTPRWLPAILRPTRAEQDTTAASADPMDGLVGYVDAQTLDLAWADWARAARGRHALSVLGRRPRAADTTDRRLLVEHVAVDEIERRLGPLVPDPRVLAATARDVLGAPAAANAGTSSARTPTPTRSPTAASADAATARAARWAQLCRALPAFSEGVDDDRTPPNDDEELLATFFARHYAGHARDLDAARDIASSTLARGRLTGTTDQDALERARQVLFASGDILTDHESKVVLRGVGIEVTRQAVANSASAAVQFADRIGYPVVLKAVSPDLRRKSDAGAVALDLGNGAAVRRAYASISAAIERRTPPVRLDGVCVAEMVGTGLDLELGIVRVGNEHLAIQGRVAMPGAPPEPLLALLPVDEADAFELAWSLRSRVPSPGLRRASDPDLETIAGLIFALDALVRSLGERLVSVELEPVRLLGGPRPYVTLDARIRQRPHVEGS